MSAPHDPVASPRAEPHALGGRGAAVEIGGGLIRRFRRMSLLKKTVITNSLVVLLGAVAGTYLTRALAGQHSPILLAALFSTSGSCVTFLVNYLAFWDHFRPLVELNRALEAIRQGQEARRTLEGVRASGFSSVLDSVRTLLDRMDDASLQFSARLLGSIEAERQRIGRELHDDTSQVLAAALLKVDLAERRLPAEAQAAHASLEAARELIERTLDRLKTVIYDLRPSMLDDLGLASALRWYAKARADVPGLTLEMRLDESATRLPAPIETALYRVGQEALANAVKHAEATRVEVELEVRTGYAALRVFDNGKGFDLQKARGSGLGLLSMQERVGLLGGKFNVVTGPGRGTRVYAVVPLPEPASSTS